MKTLTCFFFLLISTSIFANELSVEVIQKSQDRNFNGIVRGMGVFQQILTEDFGALNDRALLKITGHFEPAELMAEIFQVTQANASWAGRVSSTILDRGYLNDGSANPRVPAKLQTVIDMYNGQIMGLVRSGSNYKLLTFSVQIQKTNKKGWIIFNQNYSEALFATSSFLHQEI